MSRVIITNLLGVIVFLIGVILLILSYSSDNSQLKPALAGLGGFLLFSVVAPLIYRLTLKKLDDDKRREEIREMLGENNGAYAYGFRSILDEMDFVGLFTSLNRGDTLWWLDTYPPDHGKFMIAVDGAIGRGAVVNFLVLHPESENCEHRALEIGTTSFEPYRFKAGVEMFWDRVKKCKPGPKGACAANARFYTGLPCVPIYLVSRKDEAKYAYTSYFLNLPTGLEFPHVRWEAGPMLDHFFAYIRNKWDANEHNIDLNSFKRAGGLGAAPQVASVHPAPYSKSAEEVPSKPVDPM